MDGVGGGGLGATVCFVFFFLVLALGRRKPSRTCSTVGGAFGTYRFVSDCGELSDTTAAVVAMGAASGDISITLDLTVS